MYIVQKNNILKCNRGDSFEHPFDLSFGSIGKEHTYTINKDDIILFALMDPNTHFEEALVKKEIRPLIGSTEFFVTLEPEDTINLIPGTYYYQIKLLQKLDGDNIRITTLYDNTKFIILD